MTENEQPKTATLTLHLDVSKARTPLAVAVRAVLKLLGRTYGLRCRAAFLDSDLRKEAKP